MYKPEEGYKVLNRCCSGAPITSSRMIACVHDDIEFAMNHVRTIFHPKFTFIVGFSDDRISNAKKSCRCSSLRISHL